MAIRLLRFTSLAVILGLTQALANILILSATKGIQQTKRTKTAVKMAGRYCY